jgi:soluble lytic murein transglycosylase-like protein
MARITRHSLWSVTVLLLAACASQPEKAPVHDQIVAPPAPSTTEAPVIPDAAGATPSLAMPREWQHHNGEDYDDLFDRMRAGFALDEVQEPSIDQQLAWFEHNPDYLERVFQRGQRYLYHVVTEVEARGMPLEFALLPVVESAYEPFAYSSGRAAGMWQFIPGTGVRFGLKQNWWYDGRRDVIESTRASLDYLQALHDQFDGDWLLAIAAYNVGENYVQRELDYNRSHGKPTDFWHLKLPAETRAYVPKLLALKRLMAEPERYGLEFAVIPNEPYFAVIDTGSQIDLKIAAQLAGTAYDELVALNPGYNRWATDPDGPHRMLVPIDNADGFETALRTLTTEDRVRYAIHEVTQGQRRQGRKSGRRRHFEDPRDQRPIAGQGIARRVASGPAAVRWSPPASNRVSRARGRNPEQHCAPPWHAGEHACAPQQHGHHGYAGEGPTPGHQGEFAPLSRRGYGVRAARALRRAPRRYRVQHFAAVSGHRAAAQELERIESASSNQGRTASGHVRRADPATRISKHGIFEGQTRADRRPCHRPFHCLGHRAGHASRRCRTRLCAY